MEFTIPILLGLMVISGFIIDEKKHLFGLAILLLLIWVVRSLINILDCFKEFKS